MGLLYHGFGLCAIFSTLDMEAFTITDLFFKSCLGSQPTKFGSQYFRYAEGLVQAPGDCVVGR